MNALKALSVGLLLPFVFACSHPLEIWGTGEGNIRSLSGTRDCTLVDYQAEAKNCTKNIVINEYQETYSGEAIAGSQFHRWANLLCAPDSIECSFNFSAEAVQGAWGQVKRPLRAVFRKINNTGFDSLFIGHSFFHPIAGGIGTYAVNAGFTDHMTSRYEGGGNLGAPLEMWNGPSAAAIKGELDGRDVDLFGMTYYPGYDDLSGETLWVDYALAKNPDTRFFIGYPWGFQAQNYTAAQYETNWHAAHTPAIHAKIDALRAAYPGVDFYCIPYGQAAVELYKLFDAGDLAVDGITSLWGASATSVFKDDFSHAGSMLLALSNLVWLRAIYGVDLTTYAPAQGYNTDLKALAQAITDQHDPAYNAPPETYPDTDGIPPADRYDDDDDNDGVLDGDDVCPQDPDPSCTPITDTVTVDGTVWAQPDLFTGVSWNDINAICPASNGGVCGAGTLNGHYVTGWIWASVEDVNSLFNAYGVAPPLGPGPDRQDAVNSPWAQLFFLDPWRPTYSGAFWSAVLGHTAASFDPLQNHRAALWKYTDGHVDTAITDSPIDKSIGIDTGGWFYQTP